MTYLADVTAFAIVNYPLAWQEQGLRQTASGYGKKLLTTRGVMIPTGKGGHVFRRVYVTQYSNAGSAWVIWQGRKLFLRDTD